MQKCNKYSNSLDTLIANAKSVKDLGEFLRLVKEVLLRFDTNPKLYTKEDYFKLILLILRGFRFLYEKEEEGCDIVTEWEEILSDSKVPSEKLVKETIDYVDRKVKWMFLEHGETPNFADISFIRILGDEHMLHRAQRLHPSSLIFFKNTTTGEQLISAANELFYLGSSGTDNIVTKWSQVLSDNKVPSEKLVKETIDTVLGRTIWVKKGDNDPVEIIPNALNQYIIPIDADPFEEGWNELK